MLTVEQFCDKHRACPEGRNWALDNCSDIADAWSKLNPEWLLWVATRPGVLNDKELRLFAVFCARQVSHLLTDQHSLRAIEVAERFANGQSSQEELAAACSGARNSALVAAWSAVEAAAWAAAWTACEAAAWAAAEASAEADRAAARAAARAAGDAWAASEASRAAQAEWLRANTSPVFD